MEDRAVFTFGDTATDNSHCIITEHALSDVYPGNFFKIAESE